MPTLLHIAKLSDWRSAVEIGEYRISTLGATLDDVGFIHCSLPDQVAGVGANFYATCTDELVLLELDEQEITQAGADVRYEDGGNGELFPHIYGPINPAWVKRTKPISFTPC